MKHRLRLLTFLIAAIVAGATAQPTITSFVPTNGPIGTAVTITGTNFSATVGNNIVFFGATMAAVTVASTTQLTVTVPSGATYQPISVTVSGLTAYSSQPFILTFPGGGSITSGSFASKVDFATGADPTGVAIVDVDGDGKPDLVVINTTSRIVSVYRNTSSSGSISFAPKVNFATSAGPERVAIGDIDGDGKPDLVVTNFSTRTVSVFRNTSSSGSISFVARVDFPTGRGPYGVAIGDIDGDGKPDVAVTNGIDNTVSVLRNTSTSGSITFDPKVDLATGVDPTGVAIGDIDGDGKPDLVVDITGGSTVSVFRNTSPSGSISFAARVDFATGGGPWDVAIGDIDGDGKPDLVVTNASDNTVSMLRNTSSSGSITFDAHADFATGSYPYGAAIGDIDGDGKPDLVVANLSSNTASVLRNTSLSGSISFAAEVDFASGSNPRYVVVGDLDGDAKPDLVVTNDGSSTVSVFQNIIAPSASLSQSLVTVSPSTVPVGSTATITLQAKDGAGNNLTTGGLTVAFSLTGGGTSSGTIGSVTDNGDGTYTATFTGTTAGTAKTVLATIGGSAVTSTLPTITVTGGAVSLSQSIVTISPSTVASGSTATITLQAKDGAGNNLTTGGLTVAFSLTGGGTSSGSIGSVTDNSNGTYTATFTGTTAGTAKTVSATIGGSAVTSTLPTITVTGGAVSLSQSIVTISPSTVASGSTATITLQAKDGAGNNLTSGGLTVAFSLTGGGTSSGTIGSVTDNGNGTYIATFTGTIAGTAKTISATIGGSTVTSTLPTITVTAGAVSLSQSVVTISPSTIASGSTAIITLQAKDGAGNNVTTGGLGGLTVAFSLTGGGTSSGTIGSVTNNGNGTYSATFTGRTSGTAKTVSATIGGSAVTSTLPTITVTPGAVSLSQSNVTIWPSRVASGSTATLTFQTKDDMGNNVERGGFHVAFALIGDGSSSGTIGSVTDNYDGRYNATFTGTIAGTAKTISATIQGSAVTSTLPTVTVTPGAVSLSQSIVTILPSIVASGSTASIILWTKDDARNKLTTGGLMVAFSLIGGGTSSGTIGSVTDDHDGTYGATFTGTTPGTAKAVSATISGSAVTSTLPTITVTVMPAHSVILSQGWNLISSFLAPKDSTLDSVFVKIKPNMVLAKNGAGQVYWPLQSINTIGKWRFKDGYLMYMQATDTLTINGNEIDPQQVPLILPQGWSMVSYLRNSPMRSDSALTTLGSSLVITKNGSGQVYWPAMSINQIGDMKPGAGYQLYLSSGGRLTYPANASPAPLSTISSAKVGVIAALGKSGGGQGAQSMEHYVVTTKETGSDLILSVAGKGISDGDEVGVWAEGGLLVGSGLVMQGRAVITVWGDDPMTKTVKEGAGEGETLLLKVWQKAAQKEKHLTIGSVTDGLSAKKAEGGLRYASDGVWIVEVSEAKEIPTVFSLDQNYPNPFNPSTTIRYGLPRDAKVTLAVYNMLGQKVTTLVEEEQKAGYYQVVFQANTLSSGVYFYTISAESYRASKKLTLIK